MSDPNTLTPLTLDADINKAKGDLSQETEQGVVSQKLPELNLEMADDDMVKLTDKWESDWNTSPVKAEWVQAGDDNEKYWLGKHFDLPKADKSRPIMDNAIFEAVETYLPQVTRRNPEPVVTLDNSEKTQDEAANGQKEAYVATVKGRLADLADKNVVRLKLKKAGRHWAIYLIGIAKYGWDLDKDIPTMRIVRPRKILLDPDVTVDEDGYTGNRIGEHRKMEASVLLRIIESEPNSKQAVDKIKELVGENLGTEIQFIEWWTPQYFCWKLDKTILLKKKNPHWNYAKQVVGTQVDDYGAETATQEEIEGVNHFPVPQMPYEFLSVFNLGDQPVDKTSLIGQNLANQDMINKRNKQIDKNVDSMNGGMVVSLERSGLTAPQAKNVTKALRNGGVVVIPTGSPRDAVDTYSPTGLPGDVFNDLADKRNRMRDIFGTSGSTPASIKDEKTVRGKYQIQALDTDRIGGGVSEYLEQLADKSYNWFYQMLLVYDAAFQFEEGQRPPKMVISVKEGSLLPKDSTTIANQAIELSTAGKMSTLDLYKRLEYPNPEELAANAWLEVNAPQLLYANDPRVAQAMQMQAQAAAQQAQQEQEKDMVSNEQEKEKMAMQHEQNIETKQVEAELRPVPKQE